MGSNKVTSSKGLVSHSIILLYFLAPPLPSINLPPPLPSSTPPPPLPLLSSELGHEHQVATDHKEERNDEHGKIVDVPEQDCEKQNGQQLTLQAVVVVVFAAEIAGRAAGEEGLGLHLLL